jgi:hypothetical protein
MLTIDKKSVRVGKLVDSKHVDTVIRNYKQERWVHNSKRLGKEDSLSAWLTVEELEEFLEMVKSHGGDGLRLYWGAYSHDEAPKELYKGRQTVVFVGTKQKESETGTVNNKDIYVNTKEGSSILAYNAVNLCPPFCGELDPDEIGITILDKGDDGMAIR